MERWQLSWSHTERTLVTDNQKFPIMADSFTANNLLLGAQGTGQVGHFRRQHMGKGS